MHSMLTGRMLLQLRQYEHMNVHGEGLTLLSGVAVPLEFIQNPITTADDGQEDMELYS